MEQDSAIISLLVNLSAYLKKGNSVKKKFLVLVASLIMILNITACDNRAVDGRASVPGEQNPDTDESLAGMTAQEENSPLADWYDSEARIMLEDAINAEYGRLGMTFTISIEEPDIIIYTYQCSDAYDLSELSPNDIYSVLGYMFDGMEEQVLSDIQTFRNAYGIPLTAICVIIRDANGAMIYSRDIIDDWEPETEKALEEISSGEKSLLADWYDSEERIELENRMNSAMEGFGITISISIEEPDTIIHTYQYVEESEDLRTSREEADDIFGYLFDCAEENVVSDIKQHRIVYGIPLTTIRIVYLDINGSLLYSRDFTYDASALETSYDNLQAWLDSEEGALLIEQTDEKLASSILTAKISADGNTLVYEYYISYEFETDEEAEDKIAAFVTEIDANMESYRTFVIPSMFRSFETDFGIKLEGIRFVFYTEDGTQVYLKEFVNE